MSSTSAPHLHNGMPRHLAHHPCTRRQRNNQYGDAYNHQQLLLEEHQRDRGMSSLQERFPSEQTEADEVRWSGTAMHNPSAAPRWPYYEDVCVNGCASNETRADTCYTLRLDWRDRTFTLTSLESSNLWERSHLSPATSRRCDVTR